MHEGKQHHITANGVRLRITEVGAGPLVLLCHGFPETAHSWRHQLTALSAAGFRVVAPDLRGYGGSDSPTEVAAFSALDLLGDLVAIVEALGAPHAVVVGNDWGATLAWHAAQLRPDIFRGVVALGVPMMERAPKPPSQLFPRTESAMFYTQYFQEPGIAEEELERDIRATLRKIYFAASGDAGDRNDPTTPNPFGMVSRSTGLLGELPDPGHHPVWMTPGDFEQLVNNFTRSGFTGPLNFYRNLDRNWALQGAFERLRVSVPALFMVGERDPGLAIPGMSALIERMGLLVPDLRASVVIPGAGHWLQQETPDQVSNASVGFLKSL